MIELKEELEKAAKDHHVKRFFRHGTTLAVRDSLIWTRARLDAA